MWVTLPSFDNRETTANTLRDAVAKAPEWRRHGVVVFDVRGNTGGNSSWGDDFVSASTEPTRRGVYVEWRVSKENHQYWVEAAKRFATTFGPRARETLEVQQTASLLQEGLDSGASLARQVYSATAKRPTGGRDSGASEFRGRVFLLTDGRCFSACLDFADVLLTRPNVTHVGQTTDADTLYIDIRSAPLPSALADAYAAARPCFQGRCDIHALS
ncbi:MAG: S41 family peptidase [Myxococcaceae bacterium]